MKDSAPHLALNSNFDYGFAASGKAQRSSLDSYIEASPPFAHPILNHIRDLVHQAVPEVEETFKWSMPFFVYSETILCYMGAFKQHCRIGFWGSRMARALEEDGYAVPRNQPGGRAARGAQPKPSRPGNFERVTSLGDLPPDETVLQYIHLAAAGGVAVRSSRLPKVVSRLRLTKTAPATPAELAAALEAKPGARIGFDALSPSCRREYIEWIAEAKRPETRDRRIAITVDQVSQQKPLHSKYGKT